jgi:hypothetical protein
MMAHRTLQSQKRPRRDASGLRPYTVTANAVPTAARATDGNLHEGIGDGVFASGTTAQDSERSSQCLELMEVDESRETSDVSPPKRCYAFGLIPHARSTDGTGQGFHHTKNVSLAY